MATHSSVLAWRTPGMGETGGVPFIGSYRVRHDWSDFAAAAAAPHSAGTPGSAGRQVSLVFTTSVILFTCCLVFSVLQGLSSVPGHRNGIAGSYGNSVFNFLRNGHTVFHTGCTILHSYQQYTSVLISPHSCQHLFFFFLIVAILREGNGTPLQYSCLENPMGWGAW